MHAFDYVTDRTFSHSGALKSYKDTGVDLTSHTWIVLEVNIIIIHLYVESSAFSQITRSLRVHAHHEYFFICTLEILFTYLLVFKKIIFM